MCILAIDPGVTFGWAWTDGDGLWDYGVEKAKDLEGTRSNLIDLFNERSADIVVCEKPFIGRSAKASVSARSQAVVTLTLAAGIAMGCCPYPWEWAEVMQWKGQLTKLLVASRVEQRLDKEGVETFPKSHAIDATGIALWHMGRF